MNKTCVLVVDDDPIILKFVAANLRARDFEVIMAEDGPSALKSMEEKLPDLVILDIMMPGMDGIEVCHRIREWSPVPIIMLSAKSEVGNKVDLLNLGADDYITKPFGIEELMARVRAVMRRKTRSDHVDSAAFVSDDLEVNLGRRVVTVGGKQIKLSPIEYSLLRELVQNAGKVITHQMLLSRVWGPEYGEEIEYLRVYIGRLRNKIEPDPQNPKHILTESGVGYSLRKMEPPELKSSDQANNATP
ncbi:MAG: response regulator transcription factor [Dehalococcoidia bacterium]|nr:response regulator transcription factor [Dehalococcoidia bacterium]